MSESISDSDKAVLSEIEENTAVAYEAEEGIVKYTSAKTDTEHYVALVRYLMKNQYITKDDLPISAQRAQTRYLINSKPRHQDREMVRPREVKDGIYLETNHDSSSKIRYSARFIEDFVLGE